MADGWRFTVKQTFMRPGRGRARVGDMPEEGEFVSGHKVEVLRAGTLVFRSVAYLELDSGQGEVALVILDIDANVLPGDEVRTAT